MSLQGCTAGDSSPDGEDGGARVASWLSRVRSLAVRGVLGLAILGHDCFGRRWSHVHASAGEITRSFITQRCQRAAFVSMCHTLSFSRKEENRRPRSLNPSRARSRSFIVQLYAMGLGAGSIPLAATLNWVIKDGLGQLGGVAFSSLVNTRFDSNPRLW